jgi:NAD(P)-dependent dehydrogenase (short-subunit alcohol dehydrogenase family)
MMDLNYMGVVHAVRAVLPGMLRRKEGHLVAVASTLSLMGGRRAGRASAAGPLRPGLCGRASAGGPLQAGAQAARGAGR